MHILVSLETQWHVKMTVKVKVKLLSRVRLFATPWTVAHQAPPFMGFSRQDCWSGLPFPSPGDLPELTNIFKGLYLIDRVPEELWTKVCDIIQ